MLVAVIAALAAYVPTCFCWTEGVAAWMLGRAEAACYQTHGCCGEHGATSLGAGETHGDDSGKPDQPVPVGRLKDCVCGVQHRIAVQAPPSPLDFESGVVAWLAMDRMGDGLGVVAAPRWGDGVDGWNGTGGAGERSLLRLHCALTI